MSRAQEAAITFKANKLSSVKTQLPYGYYTLPYCRPERIISSAENLGEVLRGDRIVNSLYQVRERCVHSRYRILLGAIKRSLFPRTLCPVGLSNGSS